MGKKNFKEKILLKGIILALFYFLAWNGAVAEEVQRVQVNSLPDGIRISWNKADRSQRNVLVKSENHLPQNVNDGIILYDGTADSFTDTRLEVGKKYYYSVISFSSPTVSQRVTRTVNSVVQVVETIPPRAQTAVATVGAGSQLLGMLAIFDSVGDVWLTLVRLSQVLIAFLLLRKKKQWGVVYDWENKAPLRNIPLNVVNDRGEKIEGAVTDSAGRFGFMASHQGEYFVKVAGGRQYAFQPDHYQPYDIYGKVYKGESIKTDKDTSAVIKLNVPLVKKIEEKRRKVLRILMKLSRLPKFLDRILELLFWLGLVFIALSFVQKHFSPVTLGMAGLYLLVIILRSALYFNNRGFGTVLDKDLKTPVPFAVVKAIRNESDEEQLGIAISNTAGSFYLLKPEGAGAVEIKGRTLEGRNFRLIKAILPGQELIKETYFV